MSLAVAPHIRFCLAFRSHKLAIHLFSQEKLGGFRLDAIVKFGHFRS